MTKCRPGMTLCVVHSPLCLFACTTRCNYRIEVIRARREGGMYRYIREANNRKKLTWTRLPRVSKSGYHIPHLTSRQLAGSYPLRHHHPNCILRALGQETQEAILYMIRFVGFR